MGLYCCRRQASATARYDRTGPDQARRTRRDDGSWKYPTGTGRADRRTRPEQGQPSSNRRVGILGGRTRVAPDRKSPEPTHKPTGPQLPACRRAIGLPTTGESPSKDASSDPLPNAGGSCCLIQSQSKTRFELLLDFESLSGHRRHSPYQCFKDSKIQLRADGATTQTNGTHFTKTNLIRVSSDCNRELPSLCQKTSPPCAC